MRMLRSLRLILLALFVCVVPASSFAAVFISVGIAPPVLPVYEQPVCPEDGYMWTPGYWAYDYDAADYYWVPGAWVAPPEVGMLWTPGYWGWGAGVYAWHPGYWGPHVGYYGGVNYGFGYVGVGFAGGRWVGNSFAYNRAVTNVNVTVIHNTYHETVINNVTVNRVSYNGGPGGISHAPTAEERSFAAERHVPPTQMQRQHFQESQRNPDLAARANGGHPGIAATPRPAAFNAPGVVGAHGAPPSVGGAGRTPGQFNQQNGAARGPGQPGQSGQPGQFNGANRTPGQPGQVNGAAHPPGQQQGQPGQPGQPRNMVRTPGQPQGARAQGQPGQPAANGAKPVNPPKQQQRAKPEEKRGEKEK